jgi:glycerophosphoryl diester phosphodiesterase
VIRVIAHRGNHDTSRQNTLASYRDALAAGADAAELDVRLCRDDAAVLAHDPVQWHGRRPHVVRLSSLSRLHFLARLDEVLAETRTAEHSIPVVLDVKRAADVPAVADWCRQRVDDLHQLALWCRDPQQLRRLDGRDAFGEVALLPGRAPVSVYLKTAASVGADVVSLHPEVLNPASVEWAHRRGLRAYAWIRARGDHQHAVECGVDGLVTDWIDDALRAAGRAPAR